MGYKLIRSSNHNTIKEKMILHKKNIKKINIKFAIEYNLIIIYFIA